MPVRVADASIAYTAIDDMIAEFQQALTDMAPAHEGLRDFAHLNLHTDTQERVNQAVLQYDRRRDLLTASIAELQARKLALQGDLYPVLEIPLVTAETLEDLQQNESTISAALARFRAQPPDVASLNSTPGTPQPK